MIIKKVLNNNVVLAVDARGQDAMLAGRGIGFQRRTGDTVDPDTAFQIFRPEDPATRGLTQMLGEVPPEILDVADQISQMAGDALRLSSYKALILPIADHLNFAVARVREGQSMDFPLKWEVVNIYATEFALGQRAVDLVQHELGVALQPDEAVAFALHFVNAQFSSGHLGKTVEMTETINRFFDVIEATARHPIDRSSMSAARFVTHLRYLFIRLDRRAQITDSPVPLLESIRRSHPRPAAIAVKLSFLLESGAGKVSRDEIAYLTLHVARLLADAVPESSGR
ncbi:MAG: PRD domain-containing protein [Propioniciclava sp.]